MAFVGNGITLTTKMLKELASGAVVLSLDGATNNVSIGVQYDDTTIKVNENNQLIVGAIAISNVTDLQTTITGINNRIEALEVGTVDLSNYVGDNGISIIGKDATQPTWGGGVQSGTGGAFTIGTFNYGAAEPDKWGAQTVIETSDGKVAFKQQTNEYFAVTPTSATFNGNALVTAAQKNAANGYAGLDTNSKVLSSVVPVGNGLQDATNVISVKAGTGITVDAGGVSVAVATDSVIGGVKVANAATSGLTLDGEGNLAVDAQQFVKASEKGAASGIVPLNADGTIDRQYIGSINIQEVWSATVAADGAITIGAGQSITAPADVEVGDAITLTAEATVDSKTYAAGSMFRRVAVSEGATKDTFADYRSITMDLFAATSAEINAGTDQEKYITPAALKNSAPAFDGSNITNINVGNIAKATATTFGVVQVPSENGLSVAAGVVSVAKASADAFGTVKIGSNLTVADGVISVPAATDSVAGVVTIGVAEGNVPAIQAGGKLLSSVMPVATADAVGAVKVGTGLAVAGDGTLSVSYSYTLPAATATDLGGVKIATDAVISNTEGAIDVKYDGVSISKNTDNKLQVVDSYVQGIAGEVADEKIATLLTPVDVTSSNLADNKITVTAKAVPKGLIKKTAPFTYFGVGPDSVTYADGNFTAVIDVTGFTGINTTDWQVVF